MSTKKKTIKACKNCNGKGGFTYQIGNGVTEHKPCLECWDDEVEKLSTTLPSSPKVKRVPKK